MTREEVALEFAKRLVGTDSYDTEKDAIDHAVSLTDHFFTQLAKPAGTVVGFDDDYEDSTDVRQVEITNKEKTSWWK